MVDCNKTEVFLQEWGRMCESHRCDDCELYSDSNGKNIIGCSRFARLYPKEALEIVQKWSDANLIKTRQSEFLKTFPNAEIRENGALSICPMMVDVTYKCVYVAKNCYDCQKEYWSMEIE